MREGRGTNDSHPSLEHVACELCGSTEHEVMMVEDTHLAPRMRLVRCSRCGLAFTNPRPTEEALEYVYSAENYVARTASAVYCLTGEASRGGFSSSLNLLTTMVRPPVQLLDVGCGTGHFLELASRIEGWEVTGVELSDYAAKEAAQRVGCPVHVGTLEAVAFPAETFDVVSLWYVLEHVAHPRDLLAEVNRVLRPNGVVLIAVPNLYYLRIKRSLLGLVNKTQGALHLDEHLFHYTPKTLAMLLEAVGLEPTVHRVAEPFFFGRRPSDVGKRLALFGVQVIFRLTGFNFGGILMYARKSRGLPRAESCETEGTTGSQGNI
jgi:2-polyprenyl-3-methyl-5-hydroxy-6-metoxy-1,4-benzoquinol methylase